MTRFGVTSRIIPVAGWLLFFTFPLLVVNGTAGSSFALLKSLDYWQFCLCYLFIFYLNTRLLIPRLLLRKKYVSFFLVIVFLGLAVFFLQPFDKLIHRSKSLGYIAIPPISMRENHPPSFNRFGPDSDLPPQAYPPPPREFGGPGEMRSQPMQDITSVFLFVIVLTLSTATETTQRWEKTEKRAARAETEKTKAELSFLKAQINPHFLFNTLNNIYSLAVTGNDQTAESIMKLSNIMRFVTDDVREEAIPICREIDCLHDYIDLQRLRLGKSADITFEIKGTAMQNRISPIILLTFVENAFKHGISKREASPILIYIEVDQQGIHFRCKNRHFKGQFTQERNGIGIENTQKRLQHIYPNQHTLKIASQDDYFVVTLDIFFHE